MTAWLGLTSYLSWGVLLLLAGLSVWSVGIIIDRWLTLRQHRARRDWETARTLIQEGNGPGLREWVEGDPSLSAGMMRAALSARQLARGNALPDQVQAVDRAVKSYLMEQRMKLERGLTVLATLGANAPFIGLFGTVVGIIRAFGELSQGGGGNAAVMVGISEALIATAVGLFVAIPAVITYNAFSKQIRQLMGECEIVRDLYASRLAQFNA